MVGRLGGDEFIVLTRIDNSLVAIETAEKIIEALTPSISLVNFEFIVTASIGIALYPCHATTSSDLLQYADSAMYQAKTKGRNCVSLYSSELTAASKNKIVVESELQVRSGTLVETIETALACASLSPRRLEIEVLEECVMINDEIATQTVQALGDLDIRLSIDDFGTGYSSLNRLTQLPFDTLKMDGVFIRELSQHRDDKCDSPDHTLAWTEPWHASRCRMY